MVDDMTSGNAENTDGAWGVGPQSATASISMHVVSTQTDWIATSSPQQAPQPPAPLPFSDIIAEPFIDQETGYAYGLSPDGAVVRLIPTGPAPKHERVAIPEEIEVVERDEWELLEI